MNRLLAIQPHLIAQSQFDPNQLKLLIFGSNYLEREASIEFMRTGGMLHHYHITEQDKNSYRKRTLENVFAMKNSYTKTIDQTKQNPNQLSLFSNGFVFNDLGACVRAGVHAYLYVKSIHHLGAERHQPYLERAFKHRDTGCFGLTQLTHGSNVRGILTEAHYDHQTKEFIMNTPSKQGMKFWIGGAAQTANMSVIWAQLYIGEKCHGVHAYLVPIRDTQTHKLLPGVLIGDCGPKNGLNGIDNGFIILDKVRIPRDNQLDRISGVDDEGKFKTIIENDEKRFGLHLAALSGGRFMISTNCCSIATQAITIGIRYCNERTQFRTAKDQPQNLLIDYPLTKRRMMPLLAQTIVYYTASMKYVEEWDSNQTNIMDPKHPAIEMLHAISSVMKAKTSWFAGTIVRECRQMLGGHGYSSYSKLGVLFNDNDVNLTWEGDNHVLIQQTSKYVLEQAQRVMQKGKQTNNPNLSFLMNPPSDSIEISRSNLICLQKGLEFLQFKLIQKIQDTGMRMLEQKQKNLPTMQIWNSSQVFLGRQVALIYGDISILNTMLATIGKVKNPTNKQILLDCTRLWLLSIYIKDEFIDMTHHPLIESLISDISLRLATHSLDLLRVISTDDDVIGSPFADPNGKGIEKYKKMILDKPKNVRQEWWQEIISR